MQARLLGQRETFHVTIRAEKKNQNIEKRRKCFIQNILDEKVERVKQKVEEIKNMIVEGRVKEDNIEEFLVELVNVLRYDSKQKEVGEYIDIILGYLINVYERIKDEKNSDKNVSNILQVVNNITYFVHDVSPYQRQIFAMAQQCMLKICHKQNAIFLLTNLSFFDFYPQMTQYMSSQQFFNSLSLVIQDLPLNSTEKQNIIHFYCNLLADNNSNKTILSKHITILYMLIAHNTDKELSLKTIECLKLLIRQNKSIVYELDFEQIIGIILADNIETKDTKLKQKLLDLLRIIVKKSNQQLVKSLLDKGLFAFIINCLQTQYENEHHTIVRMMTQIMYISQNDIEMKQKAYLFLTYPVLQYIKSYYSFIQSQLKECILELVVNFDIKIIMNQPEFLDFLQNFCPSKQTPQAHKNLLRIIQNVIEEENSQQTIVLHQMIIKALQQLSTLQNGNQMVKEQSLKLLSYVEDKQ